MTKLWASTMAGHRRQVNDAILDAAAALIAERGPLSVAMSAIAERAGIGRATLYKYFPDLESILVACHARDFGQHLQRLRALSEAEHVTLDDVAEFIRGQRRQHARHRGADALGRIAHSLADAAGFDAGAIEEQVVAVLTRLLTRLADQRKVRDDHDPQLLARWLFHAVHAPGGLDDRAVSQLVVDSLAPRV